MLDANDDGAAMTGDAEATDLIVEYAATGRIIAFPPRDALLSIGDMEIRHRIRERAGRYELTRQERNEVPRILIASPALDVVRKYLLMQVAIAVRAQRRLRRIRFPGAPESLPDGFTLEETAEGQTLRWAADGEPRVADFPPGRTAASEAAKFTSVVLHSEQDIIASLEHPGGRPLFLIG